MGLSLENVAKSVTDVTSSSRFTNKNLWLDTKSAYTYQTQVEVPEYNMNSMEAAEIGTVVKGQMRPVLSILQTLRLIVCRVNMTGAVRVVLLP